MADPMTETDQIEHELAETRARMDRRLDELGTKLAPNQIVNDALAHVSGGDGADFAQTLIAKAKANPVPAALVGIGLAWLLASGTTRTRGKPDLPTRLRSAEAGVVRLDDEHPDVHASRFDDARGQVLGVARSASDTAASYSQRIKNALATATDGVRQVSHDLGSAASNAMRADGATSGRGGRALLGSSLFTGAIAGLAGLVAGTLLPVTEREEAALADIASQLRGRGRDMVQNVVDSGLQVAHEALDTAKESAQAHGLTAEKPVGELLGELRNRDLIGHFKDAAQEVADAGRASLSAQLRSDMDQRG